jgi:hypothetical protein
VSARGWDRGIDSRVDAQVANAYGQWVDRLYLGVAMLIVPVAVGDFIVWVNTGSALGLLGPLALLSLCIAYLALRRWFRLSAR